MGAILLILGILLLADALAVSIMCAFSSGEFVTMLVGFLLIIYGANYKRIKNGKKRHKIFRFCMSLMLIYIVGASLFLAIFGQSDDVTYKEDYVVVLGSGLRDDKPAEALEDRLNTAIKYSMENPDAKIIVSGGQGSDEIIAEADAMYNYLLKKGVNGDLIIKERNSKSTYENFMYSDSMLDGALKNSEVVTITNGFHTFRAKLYAKLAGIKTHTMSAPLKAYLVPICYIRESFALIKMAIYHLTKFSI